jgi:GntR family transcriptional regulator, transcriptional repressor for pyruvate dehydrogenase complex
MLKMARSVRGDMEKFNFKPLRVRRLSQVIEDSIKDLILSGQIKVGSKMPTELEISRQFGVSIVTVREALRGLEALGIILRKRGKTGGTYVARMEADTAKNAMQYFLSSRELSAEHLSQVRTIIEPATVFLASKQITPDDLANLEENVLYCRNKLNKKGNTLSTKDFFDIEDRTTEFHKLIAAATHNPLLNLVVDYMMDFLASYERAKVALDVKYCTDSVQYHEKILHDLKDGKPGLAEEHMLEHIKSVGDYYNSIEARGSKTKTKTMSISK